MDDLKRVHKWFEANRSQWETPSVRDDLKCIYGQRHLLFCLVQERLSGKGDEWKESRKEPVDIEHFAPGNVNF